MGIEAALLGTAATAATAGTAATAATAGLFGTAGAFSLGTTIGTLSTGLGLFSGIQSFVAGKQQAKATNEMTKAQIEEQARLSARESAAEINAAGDVRRKQKIAYLASGVSLSGSPLLVMEETRRRGASNAIEIMTASDAASKANAAEGKTMAGNLYTSGRNEFIKSATGALTKYV